MILIKPYYKIETEIDGTKILKNVENAARTCYKSEEKATSFLQTKSFIKRLIESGHESTIEHEYLRVRFICDRSFTHELVRHRLCAFSQESQRYVNYSKDKFSNQITCTIPPWVHLNPGRYILIDNEPSFIEDNNSEDYDYDESGQNYKKIKMDTEEYVWLYSLLISEKSYLTLSSIHNWPPERARSVLPNETKTEIVVTANLREWRHIFKLRTSNRAHPKMRELMIPLLKDFKSLMPELFSNI